jgi:hypothetical protein
MIIIMEVARFGLVLLIISTVLVSGDDHCSAKGGHPCNSRTFRVKTSSSINTRELAPLELYEEEEVEDVCWRYTWLGAEDENTNRTTNCDTSPEFDSVPCFEPIVWTDGIYKQNQPNKTDLEEKCKSGNLQNKVRHIIL